MTTIITRVFETTDTAQKAAGKIKDRGVPRRAVSVITNEDSDLHDAMAEAMVHDSAISTYADHVQKGHALLVVRATYKPLMAAAIVRGMLEKFDTIDAGVTNEHFVPDGPEEKVKILDDHPLFFTRRMDKTGYQGGPVSPSYGLKLLSAPKDRSSAMHGGRFMSKAFWPMPLLSKKERKSSVISGGRHMSRMFWPMPLLSSKERNTSVIKGGDLPFSRSTGWRVLSDRT